jgi:aminopeptidase N
MRYSERVVRRSVSGVASVAVLAVGACRGAAVPDPGPGVSRALAESRAATISDLRYDVTLSVPAERDSTVTGTVTARFTLRGSDGPLVLDFRAPAANVGRVTLDGDSVPYRVVPDHIVIPAGRAIAGTHELSVSFRSTDAALNRNDDFLYALFVPDRASTAIPVFEQPDLKARFTLALTIPADWQAVSNGALVSRDSGISVVAVTGGASAPAARHTLRFAESEPISTYLMTFAAGRLSRVEGDRDGRHFTMYHRETDEKKVARNAKAILDLHAAAIRWLEDYTGIPYPFGKFDFFAVPAFQFGGMEHPGAIWYRADGLMLDEAPSRNQELGRASLIAHETTHMWFGDLVTMRWFNDVWMKEVFANFMAAKIAGPSFPDIDLNLRFFQAYLPSAYGVDRTAGANPIRQDLENLRDAGSLYGAIIYQKAPVVMQQLENLVGESTFRDGLRRYLAEHKYANATWPDLISILDELSPEDLAAWSHAWVEEPGRPRITSRWADSGVVLRQADTWTALTAAGGAAGPVRALRWTQRMVVALEWGDQLVLARGDLQADSVFMPLPQRTAPDLILGGADGVGYGRFPLDEPSRATLLRRVNGLAEPLHRAVAWQTLQEEMLDGSLAPRALLDAALGALEVEHDELVASQVLGVVRGTYWRFLPDSARRAAAPEVERVLWRTLERAPTPGRKSALFGAVASVTLSPEGVARLGRIWRKEETPRGFPISEQQYISIAEGLAIRGVPDAAAILDAQEARITNPDRKARARFMRAALSQQVSVRDSLFRTFARVENRRRESWVLDAMGAMNHPLRAADALPNLRASLDLAQEIQETGDIFFPLRWLNATMDGHQSVAAAETVQRFLAEHPDYPPRLRGKMLQAADDLYRAARIVNEWQSPGR